MKNLIKKGFTLVELLAVIVILALIMAIAIYSISGILQSSRENVFKDTAINVLNGVKNQLLATNQLQEGKYYFTPALLDNNNDLPFGGKIHYETSFQTGTSGSETPIGTAVGTGENVSYPVYRTTDNLTCSQSSVSFVTVTYTGSQFEYSICLTPTPITSGTQRYIDNGKEADLLGSTVTTIKAVSVS